MTLNLDPTTNILIGLLLWGGMFPLILLVRRTLKLPSVGLDLAYLAVFFISHGPGAFLYVLPWYFTIYDGFAVANGFELSWFGVLAFTMALICGLFFFRSFGVQKPLLVSNELNNPRLPWLLFGIGMVSYLVIQPLVGQVASISSIITNLPNLQVIGIVIGILQGISAKQPRKILLWAAIAPLLPFLTLTIGGFLGFGVTLLLVGILFLISRIRLHLWHLPVVLVILYVGISLYITYIAGRGEIRAVVWENEEYNERIDVVNAEFSQWQWFDWRNREHLQLIDGRLNQNFLTGLARVNLDSGLVQFAEGESLQRAAIGFIPRIIWPDKPIMAGGSEMVTQYTLMDFAYGTSVSAGQVMEFYINFGTTGVIIGFAIIGFLFAWIDSKSALYLENGNLYGFLRWYLIGMALLKPGDDLTVMTAGAASAFVTSILLEYALKWWFARFGQQRILPLAPPIPALVQSRR